MVREMSWNLIYTVSERKASTFLSSLEYLSVFRSFKVWNFFLIKFLCSNYDIFLTRDCLAYSKVKPAVNQIETHPYFQRDSLVKFCLKHGVSITAHTPLGGAAANTEWFGSVSCLDDPVLKVS